MPGLSLAVEEAELERMSRIEAKDVEDEPGCADPESSSKSFASILDILFLYPLHPLRLSLISHQPT
jgi:hypothetical protein